MPVRGTPRRFHKKFSFIVEAEGIANVGFQKCSELSMEIGKVRQREGGDLVGQIEPGLVEITDVTLERGKAEGDSDLYDWWTDVVRVSANRGLVTPNYERDVDIVQLDRDGTPILIWGLERAWPTKFVAGEWDNDAEENVIQMLTLTMHSLEPRLP